jgi:peptide chain release factor 3
LLDELEEKLDIHVCPLSWPIGMGKDFKGVYNMYKKELNLFRPGTQRIEDDIVKISDLNDPELDNQIDEHYATALREDIDLIEGVYDSLDKSKYAKAQQAPVFFGSAINNFGVKEMLDTFVEIAPFPQSRETQQRVVNPEEPAFSGFIFKIHANIDPNHRNRIAFLRVCSGNFVRNKFYQHVRLKKNFRFSNPATFMAQSKSIVESAFPGDVIGLYDTGNFKIGDTLTEGETLQFKGIPSFSPELFKELVNKDPMKSKQLDKGIRQLTEEGVAQLFIQEINNAKIIGTVGELQFDVIKYRLREEYGAAADFRHIHYYKACWVTAGSDKDLAAFLQRKKEKIAYDKSNNPVFLADSPWILKVTIEDYPNIVFHSTSELDSEASIIKYI